MLTHLLQRWRQTPDPQLAQLIDRLSAVDQPRHLAQLRTLQKNALTQRLLQACQEPRDPRWATLITRWFQEPPFTTGTPFWRAAFRVLEHTADPRVVPIVQQPEPLYRELYLPCRGPLRRLREVCTSWPTGTLDPEELQPIEAHVALREATLADRDARRTELLQAVHADPDDLAARLVYADLLMEEDDPRGTFIALQCRPQTRDTRQACKALLQAHESTWLGPLEGIVPRKRRKWKNGFLHTCNAVFRNPGQVESVRDDPRWRTVEDLELRTRTTYIPHGVPWAELLPNLSALRHVAGVYRGSVLTELMFSDGPWPIRTIVCQALRPSFTWPWETERFTVPGSWALPELEELHLPHGGSRAVRFWVEHGARFRRLRFSMDPDGRLREERVPDTPERVLTILEDLHGLDLPEVHVHTEDLDVLRTPAGTVATVRAHTDDVARVLDAIGPDQVLHSA